MADSNRVILRAGCAVLIAFSIVFISGCSANANVKSRNNPNSMELDQFYDRKSKLVYKNKAKNLSAAEIIILGDLALSQGNKDQALFQYVQALELDNSNVEALCKIAEIHSDYGNTAKANKAYLLALSINPDHPGALAGMGLLFLNDRKYDEARKYLVKAEKSGEGSSWRVHNALGVLSDLENNYGQAIIQYEKALALQPDDALILNNIGYSYYMSGSWDVAEKYYNLAVNSDITFERAWRNLGLLYARKGRYDDAINAFNQIEGLPESYNDVGYISMMDGKYDQADAFFRKAIKLSPSFYEKANDNLEKNRALSKNN